MSADAAAPPLLSRPVRLSEVTRGGLPLVVEATAEERATLARAFELAGIDSFIAHLRLRRAGAGGLVATGHLRAEVVYVCGVTLADVPGVVEETVEARFAEPERAAPRREDREIEVDLTIDEEDPPEPIIGGVADVGPILAEHLALGLDPYPRAPDAAFSEPAPEEKAPSPFAKLAALKAGKGGG